MLSFDLAMLLATGVAVPAAWRRSCARLARRRTMRYLRESIADTGSAPVSDAWTPAPPARAPTGGRHGVQMYEADAEIVLSVADLFEVAMAAGDAIVVVATPAHRIAIEGELRRRQLPLGSDYLALDADSVLQSVCVGGEPDRARFGAVVGALVEDLGSDRHGVTIYGEMVGLLWDRGQAVAAMSLEGFWNELAAENSFVLLCGYRADESSCRWDLDDLRGLHSHVVVSAP